MLQTMKGALSISSPLEYLYGLGGVQDNLVHFTVHHKGNEIISPQPFFIAQLMSHRAGGHVLLLKSLQDGQHSLE